VKNVRVVVAALHDGGILRYKERFMQILSLVRAVAFCSILVVCGCASGPEIRVDMDPTANMRSFKTFAFFQPVSADSSQYTTLIGSRLRQATRAQLERIGFVYSENDPDLRVNLFLKVVDKQQVRSSGSGYYSYRGGYYGTWSGYPYVETVDYREGTLSIDLVDARRKQLVWQGVAEGEVSDEALKDPGPAVEKVVTRMFSNFPNAPE
jgi:hypothetical protein